jgi:hypothetical protein
MAEIVKLHEISHQFIGVRRGVLRSQRLILVSPKVGRLIKSEKIRGCRLEVAYFVRSPLIFAYGPSWRAIPHDRQTRQAMPPPSQPGTNRAIMAASAR